MRILLCLLALLVPRSERPRWREEWRAELEHGNRRMILGALPDAWAMRKLTGVPADAGSCGRRLFHALDQDVRYAARTLLTAPLFSASVIGSLAAGIAVTATAFMFLNASLFRPFPGIVDQDRLVVLEFQRGCGWPGCSVSSTTLGDYQDLREGMTLLGEELAASTIADIAVRIDGDPRSIRAAFVSGNYLSVLGAHPVLGRSFAASSAGEPEHAIVISHSLWQRAFGGDAAVLGRHVGLGSGAATIVGVAPPDFAGATASERGARGQSPIEIWAPIELVEQLAPPLTRTPAGPATAGERYFRYVGRLGRGADRRAVEAQAQVIAAGIASARPREGGGAWVRVREVRSLAGPAAIAFTVAVLGIPALVLLIACLNAANLLLARGASRATELSVRLALGATRWRVTRGLLIEGLLLAGVAASLSLVAAPWLAGLITAVFDLPMPIDYRVVLFTIALAVLSALGFSLVPALRLAASNPGRVIGSSRADDVRSGRRGRRAFVVVQVALSLALLASGTQLISFVKAEAPTAGIAPNQLVLASFDVRQLGMNDTEAAAFYDELLRRVAARPEVEATGLARRQALWTFGEGKGASPIIVWRPEDGPKDGRLYLGGYAGGQLFRAAGLETLQGRSFTQADASGTPRVALVNRPMAAALFDGTPVLGRTIRVSPRDAGYEAATEVTIVGVIEPQREPAYSSGPVPSVYVPSPLEPEPALTLYVKAAGSAAAAADAVRQEVGALNPNQPALAISTLAQISEERMRLGLTAARGVSLLGLLALALAAAGLYAVMSFVVHLRSREIGIRLALGADRGDVLRMVLSEAGMLVLAGSVIGLSIAFVVTKVEESEFRGLAGLDLSAFVLSAAILATVMLLAAVLPARRASRLDPVTVLRNE